MLYGLIILGLVVFAFPFVANALADNLAEADSNASWAEAVARKAAVNKANTATASV